MAEQRQGGGGQSGARSESKKAADEVREGLQSATNEGKERARSFLNEQKGAAADRAHDFADALRDTAHQLENRGEGSTASHYAEKAAQGIDHMADSLRDKDLNSLLQDTQRFAKNSPALFIGGSILVGVLLGRFLRSSRPSDQHSRMYSSSAGSQGQELTSRFSESGSGMGQQPSSQRYPGASPPAGGQL